MKKQIAVMSIDNSFTFGGAIISLSYIYKNIDKERIRSIIVSGQDMEYLEQNFPDSHCIHFIPKLNWIDNHKYLKLKSTWLFQHSDVLTKALNLARSFYWFFFITLPESLKYCRIAKTFQVDVLHFNNGGNLAATLAAKMLRIPCISHLRGFKIRFNRRSMFVAKMVDLHIAISSAARDNLLQAGLREDRVALVCNAVDLDKFHPKIETTHLRDEFGLTKDQLTYGIFGRIVSWKGIREFIMAAKIIHEKVPEAVAFIVGDASDGDTMYYNEVLNLVKEFDLEDTVIFTGYRKDVPEIMALMDIVVHASTVPEPFGRVLIEGMAVGKPVVATRAGGPLDIVDEGTTGFLVEICNSEALAEAVITLLQDHSLRAEIGQNARKKAEACFGSHLYSRKMEEIFIKLAHR